jgi:hypothetical protein
MSTDIFAAYARTYYESGYSVIPVLKNTKRPAIKDWQKFCHELPDDETFTKWERTFPACNIGLCLGPASGVVAFDFDYDWDERKCSLDFKKFGIDLDYVKNEILVNYLPGNLIRKKGKKGFTAFFKYDGQTNLCTDRHGVRLFDFLSLGRQTIIPPSIHEETEMPYQWLGDSILDVDRDAIPSLCMPDVELMSYHLGTKNAEALKSSRHGKVFLHAMSIMKIESDEDKIIRSMIKYDAKVNNPSYLGDPKYQRSNRCANEYEMAKQWMPRIKRCFDRSKKDAASKGSDKARSDDYDSYAFFFEEMYPDAKKCFLSGVTLNRDVNGDYLPVRNEVNAIRSYAMSKGLPRAPVEDHLNRWCKEKEFEMLCDLPEWDGVHRFDDMINAFKTTVVSQECLVDLFKDWCVKSIRRAHNPDIQNRCVVLKGDQGIGKDYFLSKFLNPLSIYSEEISISPQPKENFETIDGLIIANVPEIDQYKEVSVETFKDLVTRNRAKFRSAYAREATAKKLRCSFIASCNRDDLLRDTTGNRRFLIFDVKGRGEGDMVTGWENVDMGLVWAEIIHLAKTGYKTQPNHEMEMKMYIDSQSPDSPEDLVIEMYDTQVMRQFGRLPNRQKYLTYNDVSEIINALPKLCGMKMRTCTSILKRAGRYKRVGGS